MRARHHVRTMALGLVVLAACVGAREKAWSTLSDGLAFRESHPELAAAAFEEAARIDPTFPTPLARLAALHLEQDRFLEAEAAARRALELRETAEHRELLGRALLGQGQYEEALENLSLGYVAMPERISLLVPLGRAHEALEHHDDAEWFFGEAATHGSTRIDGHIGLARLHLVRASTEPDPRDELRRRARQQLGVAREGATVAQLTEIDALLERASEIDQRVEQERREALIRERPGVLRILGSGGDGVEDVLAGGLSPEAEQVFDQLMRAGRLTVSGSPTGIRPPPGAPPTRGGASPNGARVSLGRPTVRGSMSIDVVRRTLRTRVRPLGVCYERALQRDPTTTVNDTLRIVIRANGTVVLLETTPGIRQGSALHSCISRIVGLARFSERPDGPVLIDQPIQMVPP